MLLLKGDEVVCFKPARIFNPLHVVVNKISVDDIFGLWTLECVFHGNVDIHRGQKPIQVDGSSPRRIH